MVVMQHHVLVESFAVTEVPLVNQPRVTQQSQGPVDGRNTHPGDRLSELPVDIIGTMMSFDLEEPGNKNI